MLTWLEEIKSILRKIRECENHALRRIVEARNSGSGEVDHKSHEYYEGQANAYRNAAHYIENILKIAGEYD